MASLNYMFELIGSLVEAVAGYVAVSISKNGKISKKRILYIAISTGSIFFIGFSIYNLISSEKNWIYELLLFSLALSFLTYLLILALAKLAKNK